MKLIYGMAIAFGLIAAAGCAIGFGVARLLGFFESESPNEDLGPLTDD